MAHNPYPITDPELIPAKRYYDEAFYKAECEELWPHVWQMACRLEQIPNLGDWVELIGPHQTLDAFARDAGTISYEILTSLGARYHRIYRDAADAQS